MNERNGGENKFASRKELNRGAERLKGAGQLSRGAPRVSGVRKGERYLREEREQT
jgi:hypothetical protein